MVRAPWTRYNQRMKVYVLGYRQKDKDKVDPPKRPFERIEDVEVQYCKEPEWKIAFRELAESELLILRACLRSSE